MRWAGGTVVVAGGCESTPKKKKKKCVAAFRSSITSRARQVLKQRAVTSPDASWGSPSPGARDPSPVQQQAEVLNSLSHLLRPRGRAVKSGGVGCTGGVGFEKKSIPVPHHGPTRPPPAFPVPAFSPQQCRRLRANRVLHVEGTHTSTLQKTDRSMPRSKQHPVWQYIAVR